MKTSTYFIIGSILVYIIPNISQKVYLYTKYSNKDWVVHSARKILPMDDVTQIKLENMQFFTYEYNDSNSVLEFNHEAENVRNSVTKDQGILSIKSGFAGKSLFIPEFPSYLKRSFKLKDLFLYGSPLKYILSDPTMNYGISVSIMNDFETKDFRAKFPRNFTMVYKGRALPKISAVNSNFYIAKVKENQSFEMDLDFSKCNWENYIKEDIADSYGGVRTVLNRSKTLAWNMDTVTINIKNGTYYFNKGLHAKKIIINASLQADLNFESDNYDNTEITVTPTVLLRAPYSIWKNLKLNEK